jgi:predicted PurR-regulated permease PerM
VRRSILRREAVARRKYPNAVLERLLRAVAVVTSLIIVISFVMFAVDKLNESSAQQQRQLTQEIEQPSPSATGEREREKRHGDVREAIDDADDFLLSPFKDVVSSSDTWVTRGVPSLIGLLVYGFLLGFLARFMRGRVRRP